MTKSTITRERAQQIFLGNGPELSASEERELARMALAAMDSESDCKERKLFCSTDTARMRKAISVSAGTDVAQPYRHAQPESECEKLAIENLRSTMEGIGHIRRTLEETFGGLHGTHVEPDVLAECKAICDAIYAAYRHAQPAPVVPNGLRLALSNAGIAAPESDEMLAATCEKHIQALVTWVKDRKSFQSAPVAPSFEEWISAANQKPLGRVKDAMRESCDACRAAMLIGGKP